MFWICILDWNLSFVKRRTEVANKNYKWAWESSDTVQAVQVRRLHKSSTRSWLFWGYFLPEIGRVQITLQHIQHMEALQIGNTDTSSKTSSFTMKQSPADWSWLTVTFPRVMRHVTAATVTPIYLTFVTAKLWKIAFKKSRPWPPIWLDTYARPTFQPKRYLSILFIECVQPLGFQWGELHCCYCWRFHLVDWNDPTWPQGQRTR